MPSRRPARPGSAASASSRSRTSRASAGVPAGDGGRAAGRGAGAIRSATRASRDSASRRPRARRGRGAAPTPAADQRGSASDGVRRRRRSAARAASGRRRTAPACRSRPVWPPARRGRRTAAARLAGRPPPAGGRRPGVVDAAGVDQQQCPVLVHVGRVACSVKWACSTSETPGTAGRHGPHPSMSGTYKTRARPAGDAGAADVRHQDRRAGPRRPRDLAAAERDGVPGQRDRRTLTRS